MTQLDLRLADTDAQARAARRLASRRKWQDRLTRAIRVKALRIDAMELPQDSRILCPRHDGHGWFCQWVAGHYGGCVMGRQGSQWRLS